MTGYGVGGQLGSNDFFSSGRQHFLPKKLLKQLLPWIPWITHSVLRILNASLKEITPCALWCQSKIEKKVNKRWHPRYDVDGVTSFASKAIREKPPFCQERITCGSTNTFHQHIHYYRCRVRWKQGRFTSKQDFPLSGTGDGLSFISSSGKPAGAVDGGVLKTKRFLLSPTEDQTQISIFQTDANATLTSTEAGLNVHQPNQCECLTLVRTMTVSR